MKINEIKVRSDIHHEVRFVFLKYFYSPIRLMYGLVSPTKAKQAFASLPGNGFRDLPEDSDGQFRHLHIRKLSKWISPLQSNFILSAFDF